MPILLAMLALLLSLSSWAQNPTGWSEIPAAAPAPSADHYQVGPGDVLTVQVYGEDGLTGQFPVNDAGELDFPLLGTLAVQEHTPPQIAALIRERLAHGFIIDPEVTVWIDSFGSQPVQVLGAVAKPGTYYVRGATNLLQILGEAGGVSGEGVNEVRLKRAADGGALTVIPYDDLVSQNGGDVAIMAGDVVYVPESLVYVQGQVEKPGSVPFRENLTVTRCLAEVGGAAETANLRRVTILRGETRIRVNVRRILQGKAADVVVQAGDQVFVEQSIF